MTSALIWIPTAVVVASAMEFWAALLHGRLWHGTLWPVHRSHHSKRHGRFELNDALSGLHAPIAVALILYGCAAVPSVLREILFGAGLGMTAFGLAYVVVHDGFVHGRLPLAGLGRVPWLSRIRAAHRVHHGRGGAPYGFFLGPRELERARAHGDVSARPTVRRRASRPSARPRSG